MRGELALDIFFANDLLEPVHVRFADSVEIARAQMEQIRKAQPGGYFVWDPGGFRVSAQIDTTKRERTRKETGC